MNIFASFDKVVILSNCHRLSKVEKPQTQQDFDYNDRAERWVHVLRRLRDLEWTIEDYYWLCKRKRSQLTTTEKLRFAMAPVLMDFRRENNENPEHNCNMYNRRQLRLHAHQHDVPIVRISATHEGVDDEEGLAMDDVCFQQLSTHLELAEGARIILTHNLAVEHRLMNGTQGTVHEIVYESPEGPNDVLLSKRRPLIIVCCFLDFRVLLSMEMIQNDGRSCQFEQSHGGMRMGRTSDVCSSHLFSAGH